MNAGLFKLQSGAGSDKEQEKDGRVSCGMPKSKDEYPRHSPCS